MIQKMSVRLAAVATVAALALGCSDGGDNNDAVLGLSLLALASGPQVVGSQQARSSATGGVMGANAGTGAVISGTGSSFAFLHTLSKERMIAAAKDAIRRRHLAGRPAAIPTAFSCQDGTCNKDTDEVIIGDGSCFFGGTVDANAVQFRFSGNYTSTSYDVTITQNGSYTLNSCGVSGLDYAQLPAFAVSLYTLSGDVTVAGTQSQDFSIVTAGPTTTQDGTFTTNSTASSTNLVVNGTPSTFDLTDTSTFSIFAESTVGGSSTFVYTGRINLSGTANGEQVIINVPLNFNCTIDASLNITCI